LSVIEEKQQFYQTEQQEEDPLAVFLYALKAPETKKDNGRVD
jgi:hypothetical protein